MYGLAIFMILVIHTIGRIGCYCSDIRTDSYTYAAFSYRMVHGDVLYRDMSLDKPPAIMVANAPAYLILPASRWSLIPIETLLMLLGYAAVYLLAREMFGHGPALIVTVTACVCVNYFSTLDFTGEGFALAECYLILPQVGAAMLYRRAMVKRRMGLLVAGGVCLGVCLAAKQTALPLFAAVVVHCICHRMIRERDYGLALAGTVRILLGVVLGLAPFALMVLIQGTWRLAVGEVTVGAAPMLTRETGWPDSWRDVTPLWAPMVWIALSIVLYCRQHLRRNDDESGASSQGALRFDVTFLILWQVLECVLLIYLPRRSYHYYVLSFIPLILLSGTFWSGLLTLLEGHGRRTRSALITAMVLWSMASMRPALNELIPVSLARWKQFDAQADQDHFEHVVRWENGSLGVNDGKWPGES